MFRRCPNLVSRSHQLDGASLFTNILIAGAKKATPGLIGVNHTAFIPLQPLNNSYRGALHYDSMFQFERVPYCEYIKNGISHKAFHFFWHLLLLFLLFTIQKGLRFQNRRNLFANSDTPLLTYPHCQSDIAYRYPSRHPDSVTQNFVQVYC